MLRLRDVVWAGVVGSILSMAAVTSPASAQVVFTWDPTVSSVPDACGEATDNCDAIAGAGTGTFDARFLDLTFSSVIDQDISMDGIIDGVGDTFEEVGAGFVSDIAFDLGVTNLADNDLDDDYDVYFVFSGEGIVNSPLSATFVDTVAQPFVAELWLDQKDDTTFTRSADVGNANTVLGGDQDGIAGLAAGAGETTDIPGAGADGPAYTFSNTSDDIRIARSVGLEQGEISFDPGFVPSVLATLFLVDTDIGTLGDSSDDVIQFPGLIPNAALFDGLASIVEGVIPADFTDAIVSGSNISLTRVPEPASLGLLGFGLVGLGFALRRRRRLNR